MTLLNHGQRTLDLRGTSIRKLMLDMTGLEELWLCEGTELLLFQNKGPDACAIHAPEDGSGLTLQFIGEYRPHTELLNLRGLHGIELKDFDLTGLAAVHPHLKELRLWGAPGNLGSFSAVGGFRELTNLSTFDLFGFGADDIPTPEQMPELRWFWMTSLPETAAKAAKQLWKSKPGMDLRITKPGNRSGWRKIWTIPSGAGTAQNISLPPPRKGSQSIPQDPLPADEAGRRTGRGCPGPGAGRGGRLHPDLQQDGLHRNRETG